MAFLDAQSRTVLFDPPDVYEEALARYALSAEDITHGTITGIAQGASPIA